MHCAITVEAHPNTSNERVELADAMLRVWVRVRSVAGQANLAIGRAIAKALGLRRGHVQVVGGITGKHKIVDIDVADLVALRERLTPSQ